VKAFYSGWPASTREGGGKPERLRVLQNLIAPLQELTNVQHISSFPQALLPALRARARRSRAGAFSIVYLRILYPFL
jgi:hypothetical protein